MNYIDLKYIRLISSRLEKFSEKTSGKLFNFRCPYCGDSKKNKNRTRGFLYLNGVNFMFKCHNCGYGRNLSNFILDMDPILHEEFVMEKFKEKNESTPKPKYRKKLDESYESKPIVFGKADPYLAKLIPVNELNSSHSAIEYLASRNIPEEFFSDFFYTGNFAETFGTIDGIKNDPRVVCQLRNEHNKVIGYQGRSILKACPIRYVNVMLSEEYSKLYGLHRIDTSKTVLLTEGIFDSLFLSNSIAMCGSDVSIDCLSEHNIEKRVFILDNEPRKPEIIKKYEKLIDANESVVLWPSDIKEKDINDMILASLDPAKIISENTFSGLEAKLKFSDWKKI